LIGVVIDGPAPLGRLTFRFHEGLTVLYGRNGAGKSRLLTAITSCLEGATQPGGKSWLVFRCSDPEADAYDPDDPDAASDFEVGHLIEHLNGEAVAIDPDYTEVERIATLLERIARRHLGVRPDDTERMTLVEEITRQALFIAEATGSKGHGSWTLSLGVREEEGFPRINAYLRKRREVGEAPDQEEEIGMAPHRTGRRSDAVRMQPIADCWRPDDEPWVPMPVVPVGDWQGGYQGKSWVIPSTEPSDISKITVDALRDLLRKLQGSHLGVDGIVPSLSAIMVEHASLPSEVSRVLRELEQTANQWLEGVLLDAPPLVCDVRPFKEWAHWDPWQKKQPSVQPLFRWSALDRDSLEVVDIGELSSAQRRWAFLAVARAVHKYRPTVGGGTLFDRVMLIDEPETALHTTAQHHLAAGLLSHSRGSVCIVATHSAAFLCRPEARLCHVARDEKGKTVLHELPASVAEPLHAGDLGLTAPELLQMTRAWVIVEGSHDQAVLEGLIGDGLKLIPARVLPMRGTNHALDVVGSQILFDYTDAPVLVVLDRTNGAEAQRLWAEAVSLADAGNKRAAKDVIGLLRAGTSEGQALYEMCSKAVDTGRHSRIDVFGLTRPDIIEYLPVEAFVPAAESWTPLVDEWKRDRRGRDFKAYLADIGTPVSVRRIQAAVEQMDSVPGDIAAVLDAVRALLSRRTQPPTTS
jgi:ABC-type transport system involved in cytochrome c biogenesis ATPase subunit